VFPFYGYYTYYPAAYGYQAPAYWYYCPTAGAYYPNVQSCPEAWVPVPASKDPVRVGRTSGARC